MRPLFLLFEFFCLCMYGLLDYGGTSENLQEKQRETSFSPLLVFLFSRNSRERFWGLIFSHLWIGRARHLGPTSLPPHLGVEVLNVGSWLTHGIWLQGLGLIFLLLLSIG